MLTTVAPVAAYFLLPAGMPPVFYALMALYAVYALVVAIRGRGQSGMIGLLALFGATVVFVANGDSPPPAAAKPAPAVTPEKVYVACTECESKLKVATTSLGKKMKCPKCSAVFVANLPDETPTAIPVQPMAAPAPGPQTPPPPAHNGPAFWIKASAQHDGTVTVTNQRNGFSKTYAAKP